MAVVKDLAQLNLDIQEQKDKVENVDFKMVTFSLAGKEYGVDILSVKEIAKADKFTYVPNAASFIRGVYNLRGDIIPIIDLRTFFQMPREKKNEGSDNLENMLILRINDQVYGTIVDKIDKVVGINRESIQPPHPIFGDINIKYISGVVEKQGSLYIILDVIRIFSVEDEKGKTRGTVNDTNEFSPAPQIGAALDEQTRKVIASQDSAIEFIKEGLAALRGFIVTDINQNWLRRRFNDWSIGRSGDDLQLQNISDADEYLKDFDSPYTGQLWGDNYAAAVGSILPNHSPNRINVWNPGCCKGYESYSFACVLKNKYPDAIVKIWANDKDIMSVSQAPNMVFEFDEIPEYCQKYMVKGNNGYSFNQVIKDSIVFEYHDIMHENVLPELDIVLARDILSYLLEHEQAKIIDVFKELLKTKGMVFLGRNEELTGENWRLLSNDPVSAFQI